MPRGITFYPCAATSGGEMEAKQMGYVNAVLWLVNAGTWGYTGQWFMAAGCLGVAVAAVVIARRMA